MRRLNAAMSAFAMSIALAACQESGGGGIWQGYVEGEFVLIAPEAAGRIESVFVERGATVDAGAPLFAMLAGGLEAARDEAQARVAQAEAQLDDLLGSAKRPEEIEVIRSNIAAAEATVKEAEVEARRQDQLASRDFASKSDRDAAVAARDRAQAQLEALRNELAVAHLPARSAQVVAAERNLQAARATLDNAQWQLDQASISAPMGGTIEEVVRRPGEAAGPAMPVISLLPAENRTIRFFVPEIARAGLSIGQRVSIACDSCPSGLTGMVSFIADEAEFTPPVIYSLESRDKLVYLVEAAPGQDAARLSPGQPVDVQVAEAAL